LTYFGDPLQVVDALKIARIVPAEEPIASTVDQDNHGIDPPRMVERIQPALQGISNIGPTVIRCSAAP
jgi:hypothetical protein